MTAPLDRPLSPHLQIYRWPLNMAMSILHRMTGSALAVGLLMLTWMLVAIAAGPDAYKTFTNFTSSFIGTVMLMGWAFCVSYHFFSGLRHLAFDTVHLFKIEHSEIAAKIVLVASVLLTAVLWFYGFGGVKG